ncbi:unnamed protein product [Sphenostylis stenocarpa]|uniref:Uncharacterized protein n=1 Tax=Sphenostylis stenocarpa TaxID=92480 RepID=A0AA86VKJ8_9FABA|nr:unnamed protein product [Sphenostylis stenocarpa]
MASKQGIREGTCIVKRANQTTITTTHQCGVLDRFVGYVFSQVDRLYVMTQEEETENYDYEHMSRPNGEEQVQTQ